MPLGKKNTVIPGCGLHHIAILTSNLEKSLHLYRDILGMTPRMQFQINNLQYVLLDMGDGSYIELKEDTAKQDAPAYQPVAHIALATSDTRKAIEHVRKAGYEVTIEPKDIVLGTLPATIAFFRGPNGELVELLQENG